MMKLTKRTCFANWMRELVLASVVLIAGCSSNGDKTPADAGTVDSTVADSHIPLPDGYQLWPCEKPGQACNAHDPCAIDPVCGQDKLCYPTKLQYCDDGLECTEDICKGMGLCENVPTEGVCALPVLVKSGGSDGSDDAGVQSEKTEIRCFKEKQKNPDDACQFCDPEESQELWTGANGGGCDDGNPCSKDDYCQAGVCKGVDYRSICEDDYGCTETMCDGKGGCIFPSPLKEGWCLINEECFQEGTVDPLGCGVCDPSESKNEWTPLTSYCLIGGACYKPQDLDPTGCGICDPAKNETDWTPLPDLCKIDGTCYQKGDQHPGKCAECDPDVNTDSWTVIGSTCLINNVCKNPGDTDTTGCSVCDPTQSKTAWTQLAGLCKIDGQCYDLGDPHPGGCAECDPAVSSVAWTVKGNDCLINNVCKIPGDKDATGCGQCDPATSKTEWTPVPDTCLINGKCYTPGTTDPTGCGECDPLASATAWTVKGDNCLIADTCYDPGEADTTGCATCVPTASKTSWTPNPSKCLINGQCFADLATDTTGCLQCDAKSNPTMWSPVAGANTTTYDFETGSAKSWTIVNSDPTVGWLVSTKRPSGGSYSLYYGDPVAGNYDGAGASDGSATMPPITLASGMKAGMTFMLWMDTETGTSYDQFKIYVGTDEVWEKDSSNVTMMQWQSVSIDLSNYAGQTISIKFEFDTIDSAFNDTEGIYIDDITVYDNC